MTSELVPAWRMGNEANLFLLRKIPEPWLQDRYAPRTRSVAAQFAHMHSTRLRWLDVAAPELAGRIGAFPKGAEPGKSELAAALEDSGETIARFLEECAAAGKVRSWKGPPASFLGYMLAHEAHHRGLAMVAMRVSGHRVPQEVVYGQWEWGKLLSAR